MTIEYCHISKSMVETMMQLIDESLELHAHPRTEDDYARALGHARGTMSSINRALEMYSES